MVEASLVKLPRYECHSHDDQSSLVEVMARCRQATSHYLIQCWPRSLLPYGLTRPQWVNTLRLWQMSAILQKTFSNWFSNWFMKIVYFDSHFIEIVTHGWIDNTPALVQTMAWQQTIIWTNDCLLYWCMHASLGLKEFKLAEFVLTHCGLVTPSHYLNQCWLIIDEVPWQSSQGIILRRCEDTNQ